MIKSPVKLSGLFILASSSSLFFFSKLYSSKEELLKQFLTLMASQIFPASSGETFWRTLVHDWSYENRAIYFTELSKLNAQIELVDPHRVYITGPTRWKPADVVAPPALRPSVVILLAMLAAPGVSILRDVYSINRGYEELAARLNSLGAEIEVIIE